MCDVQRGVRRENRQGKTRRLWWKILSGELWVHPSMLLEKVKRWCGWVLSMNQTMTVYGMSSRSESCAGGASGRGQGRDHWC